MDHFRTVGMVGDLDGDRLVLFQSQQRAGDQAVVGDGLQLVARRQIERGRAMSRIALDLRGRSGRRAGDAAPECKIRLLVPVYRSWRCSRGIFT